MELGLRRFAEVRGIGDHDHREVAQARVAAQIGQGLERAYVLIDGEDQGVVAAVDEKIRHRMNVGREADREIHKPVVHRRDLRSGWPGDENARLIGALRDGDHARQHHAKLLRGRRAPAHLRPYGVEPNQGADAREVLALVERVRKHLSKGVPNSVLGWL
jgi:hypothetical protein